MTARIARTRRLTETDITGGDGEIISRQADALPVPRRESSSDANNELSIDKVVLQTQRNSHPRMRAPAAVRDSSGGLENDL